MRIVFLHRARGEFWSIEELFQAITDELPSAVKYTICSVPRIGANAKALLANLLWSSKISADIIHITGDIHYTVIGIWRAPSVLTIHDLRFIEESRGIRRRLLWFLWLYLPANRAQQITVISEFTKQRLLSSVRIRPDKVAVIPDCVSPDFQASPKPQLSDPPVVLHVGTTPNKNLERLAAACEGMDIELWVLGHLTQNQRDLLSEKKIHFREYYGLARADVVALYQRCDLVSFVSLYEGFGLPILEGQAVGRPVLTSNIAPMTEVSGGAALHVEPKSIDSIRTALEELLTKPEVRERLIAEGFDNVRKYSAKAIAEQYYQLYKKILS